MSPPDLNVVTSPTRAPEIRADARPWELRFARPCSWGDRFDAGDRLIACRAVFDAATGRYVGTQPSESPLVALPNGSGSVWGGGYWGDDTETAEVVVRGPDFTEVRRIPLAKGIAKAIAVDDQTIIGVGDGFTVAIDIASGLVSERSLPCDYHGELSTTPNGLLCVRHVGSATSIIIEGSDPVEFDGYFAEVRVDSAGRYVVTRGHELLWLGRDGVPIRVEQREQDVHLLDILSDGRLFVLVGDAAEVWKLESDGVVVPQRLRDSGVLRLLDRGSNDRSSDDAVYLLLVSSGLERWTISGDALNSELITEVPSEVRDDVSASFVGPYVVVHQRESMLWFQRGAGPPSADEVPLFFSARLDECSALARDGLTFTGDYGTINREMGDVGAFECGEALVRASRSDADEFAGFESDAAWARAAIDRYANYGSERWGFRWHLNGNRIAVGHYYIGGCERTHFIVTIVESGTDLEIYTAIGVESPLLVAIPETAERIPVDDGAYVGDPSIGFHSN